MADTGPRLVVHVVHRFATGGLENGVVNLVNHMPHDRWRHAIVAVTEVDPSFAARIRRPDVELVSLHKPPGQGLWLYPRLWQLFRHWRPTVVHTRNLGTLEFQLPACAAGVRGRVHGEHGRDIDDVDGTNRRHILLRRAYRPFVAQHIALGQELADYLRDSVAVPSSRLTAIYNGVDPVRFAPAHPRRAPSGCPFTNPEHWIIGTVGRLQAVKAQTHLVRAFVELVQLNPERTAQLRLVVVGDGPLRGECESVVAAAGLQDRVWFAGERADVPDVMRGLDCFVLPSLAEGISNTILEAMASGLPVVATAVGAAAELVDEGVSGHVVPAGDVPAMAQTLLALATDPARAARMGEAGRSKVEQRFSLQAMVRAYAQVYERAAGLAR